MSDELIERLEALAREAREAGRLPELMSKLTELARTPEGVAPKHASLPGRFGMIGESAPMVALYEMLERVANSAVPVLIQGETGTGKELVARALHDHSPRKKKRFLAENCAAVSANLLESELFGHTKGAFTGAIADRQGHFQAADGGTVFLDEIGDMPLEMQSKLLRVLQSGELRPVGASRTLTVDVRVVAATHHDLPTMVAEGRFRSDLYYRLNIVTLELPPLRERGADIGLLAQHVLTRLAHEGGLERARALDPAALRALEAWRWPGNVRELENELQRACALGGDPIRLDDLSPALLEGL